MVKKREFTYASRDGKTQIHAIEWKPEGMEIKGVLQIVHGMVEFIDRYDDFAKFLAEKGFAVIGNDHLGHGGSVASKKEYGYFCEKDGNAVVLGDMNRLKILTEKQYPGIPYYILGHSMGSFLTRQFLYTYGSGIDGAIIMGTGTKPPLLLKLGKGLIKLLAVFRGWHYRSPLIDRLAFGGYNRYFQPGRTDKDWLTRDEGIVDQYLADERCSFRFTLNGYYNLFVSIEAAGRSQNVKKLPKDLPVLFVSGEEDPVGDFGRGVEKVRKSFRNAGMTDVTWILYEKDRHEILNELDRENVYRDIYAWLYVRLTDPRRGRKVIGE